MAMKSSALPGPGFTDRAVGRNSTAQRFKVLLSAYACEPFKGSEPADGWNWALQMSRFHDVWVLTRQNNRASIERAPLTPEQQRIRWVYYDLPRWARFWKRGSRGIQLYYLLWQLSIWRLVARLHRQIQFDLVHHVTFGKYWIPSYLPLLPVHSIVGPVGGGESTPPALAHTFSPQGRRFEWKRDLARRLAEADPITRATYRRADLVLTTTDQTRARVERMGARRVLVEPQFGMDDQQMEFFGGFPIRTEPPFRLISIGRLLHWKGFHLGLQAFARFCRNHPESEYWIVNDGPEAKTLKRLAAELGISRRVTFWGHLPTIEDVYQKLAQADVLVHPALHEAFGNVCLEGLAAGRPVICLDTGGPALQVTEACGYKAPVSSLDACLNFMAEAMRQLCRNPSLRLQMGMAARRRVRSDFHWTQKAERMNEFYQSVCAPDVEASAW
jgi:glycosyltransferase involved in cell wall biosynthesis